MPGTRVGSPSGAAKAGRCPGCGQALPQSPTDRCLHCGHRFEVPSREVPDRTPYGRSEACGTRAFRATCWWVLGASAPRLAQLALIPRTPASRRFVTRIILLLAFAAALAPFGLVGWRSVTNAPREATSLSLTPSGRGWYHVAQASPRPPYRGRAVLTDVWWNPAQSILASAGGFLAVLLAAWIILACQGAGVRRALGPSYRDQGRLEAGLRYSTAWLVWVLPAAVFAVFSPLADISAAAGWPIVIPRVAFYGPAVLLALIAGCGYVLTLVRLGAAVPVAARTRVVLFLAFWNPLLCLLWMAAAAAGVYVCLRLLIPELQWEW